MKRAALVPIALLLVTGTLWWLTVEAARQHYRREP